MLADVIIQASCWAVVMGNTSPYPIVSSRDVRKYRREMKRHRPDFKPVISVMLTKDMTVKKLRRAYKAGAQVLKMIPVGTSTGSSRGIALIELPAYYPVLLEAKRLGMVFSGHWELDVDQFGKAIPKIEQEEGAIPILAQLVADIPGLKVVVEHTSVRKMIEFVKGAPANVVATLTLHHATVTYDQVFSNKGSVKAPNLYCKPCAKTRDDCRAVIEAMTSGNPKFFFGSDSAPWHRNDKKLGSEKAGIFTPYKVYVPRLVELFEREKALHKLEAFLCIYGPLFYGFQPFPAAVNLRRRPIRICKYYKNIPVFLGGELQEWSIV